MPAAVYDRRRAAYQDAMSLTQDMLNETARGGENQIEAIGILTKVQGIVTYTLRFADRPKFVGNDWYEGRARFPQVKRTLGEPLAPTIQLSQFEVQLANMDGFYNQYLEGGDTYLSWIGATLEIKMGLRDVAASFVTVFRGTVPEQDGFESSRDTITIRANDRFNELDRNHTLPFINSTDFPSAPDDVLGKTIPMVLGDWEAGYNYTSNAGAVDINDSGTTVQARVDSPVGFYGGTKGYYVGGGFFVFSIGTYTPDNISDCHVRRGDALIKAQFNAVPQNTAGYWSVQVTALAGFNGGPDVPYTYQAGDIASISVKVPYNGSGEMSSVPQLALEILYTLGGKSSSDIHTASWAYYATKSSPAASDFVTIKGRLWIGEDKKTILAMILGLLEQVRLEMFPDKDGLYHLTGLQPEEFPIPADANRVDQFDLAEDTTNNKAAENLYFNRAFINYGYTPVTDKTERQTSTYYNPGSRSLIGKDVFKAIDCPNIYVEDDAVNQLTEFLRLYGAGLSYFTTEVSWVHLLRDLSEFTAMNYSVGGLAYQDAPMMIRDISINLSTGAVQLRHLNFINFYYSGYTPANYMRFLSGASASILLAS